MQYQSMATVLTALMLTSCTRAVSVDANHYIVGAWHGSVQFSSGSLAATKDLEFMYVFNVGGTMTESSNYDGAPPVPPAYGIWQQVGERDYKAKYLFYFTKPPASFDEIAKGNGWSPNGHGVLTQAIKLSEDGLSFESTIRLQMLDQSGKALEPESTAVAKAERV